MVLNQMYDKNINIYTKLYFYYIFSFVFANVLDFMKWFSPFLLMLYFLKSYSFSFYDAVFPLLQEVYPKA